MQHPFDGVTRRTALGAMAAAAAGALGLGSTSQAQVKVTTLAVGEEGAATAALREAGGGAAVAVSSEPFGEEAGRVTSRMTPGLEDGKAPPTKAKGEDGTGGPTVSTEAVGEEGGPVTAAINEGGGPITRALREGGIGMGARIVTVHPDTQELKDDQFKTLWGELTYKDPVRGVQACATLYGAKKVVPFIKDNLKADKLKLPQADAKTVAKLIDDLDSDSFETREEAEAELAKLGSGATVAIEKAIKDAKSAEQKMRLARLLEKSKDQAAMVQARRAIEVLVALRTDEAKEVLEKLSKGDDKEWLTEAAKKALERAKEKLPETPTPPVRPRPPIRPLTPVAPAVPID